MGYDRLKNTLIRHEGLSLNPYICPENNLTIGVGHNLDANGISKAAAMFILTEDIAICENDLKKFSWFDGLSDVRQEVLINLCFNIGFTSFLNFKRMISALESGNFEQVSEEMKDSKWYHQVGSRAVELVEAMKTNSFKEG
jgi:lysozyme